MEKNDQMSIDKRLAEIQARCEKASSGPWTLEDPWKTCNGANLVRTGPGVLDFFQCSTTDDNHFCAHARTDIPRLVAEVEKLIITTAFHRRQQEKLQARLAELLEI